MKNIRSKFTNFSLVMLYLFICVPLLMVLSYGIYSLSIDIIDASNIFLLVFLGVFLLFINIGLIYLIARLFVRKASVSLNYHIVLGAIVLIILMWINVYYQAMESSYCNDDSAILCVGNIFSSKVTLLFFIAFIYYYLMYIVLHKMVLKNKKSEVHS